MKALVIVRAVVLSASIVAVGCGGSGGSSTCDGGCTTGGAGTGGGGTSGTGGTTGSAGTTGTAGHAGGAGTGGAATVTHCDVEAQGAKSQCIEYEADDGSSRPQGCTVLHGTYADGPCDHASSSGGCNHNVAWRPRRHDDVLLPAHHRRRREGAVQERRHRYLRRSLIAPSCPRDARIARSLSKVLRKRTSLRRPRATVPATFAVARRLKCQSPRRPR